MINPASSPSRLGRLEFERRRIVELCAEPTSIGELAGQIDVPLGVAMVLASDLVSEGVLVCNDQIDGTNVELIERLIEGIRSQ